MPIKKPKHKITNTEYQVRIKRHENFKSYAELEVIPSKGIMANICARIRTKCIVCFKASHYKNKGKRSKIKTKKIM